MTSLARRAMGGAGATLVWQTAKVALLLVSVIVLARILSPGDFGLIAMVTSITGIAGLLRDFGLSVATLQSKTLSTEEKSNLFWLNTAIGAALTVIVFIAAWPIAALYGDPRLVLITQAISVTFLIGGVTTQFKAQINRDLRFFALGVAEVVPQAIGLALAVWIATTTGSYLALVVQAIATAILELSLSAGLARWRPGRYSRSVPVRRFVTFATALVGTQGLAYVSKNIDSILLGIFFGPTLLGLYNRAYQIVVLPLNQVTTPLSRVAVPVLAQLQDQIADFSRYLRTAQFATIGLTSVFFGTMMGFGGPLVLLVLGPQWEPAAPILQVLAFSAIFRALGQVPYWIFVSLGYTGSQFKLYLFGQPIIIVAIALGAVGGPLGVAIGCSIGYAIFWMMNMWWAGRVSSVRTGALSLSGLFIVVAVAGPLTLIGQIASNLFGNTWLALLTGGLVGLVTAIGVVLLIPPYRRTLSSLVRTARSRRGPDPSQPDEKS